jgi:hypothetical protein
MIKDNKDLLEEFYQEIKEEYPSLSLEELSLVCQSPWVFLRETMQSGKFSKVRFKYFGTFQVHEKRVSYILSQLDDRLQRGTITQKHYDNTKKVLEKWLEKENLKTEKDD